MLELAVRGLLDQVAAVLLQRLVGLLGAGARDALLAAHLGERLEEAIARDLELSQDPAGVALGPLLEERKQQMLDRDVLVLQAARLLLRLRHQPGEALRDVDLAGLCAGPRDFGPPLE
jgi:hypothetical protein